MWMDEFVSLLIYNLITFIMIAIGMCLCKRYVKKESIKDLILKISSVLVIIVHYSVLYVDYFKNGSALVEANMILLIYPCNMTMWMLVAVAFMKKERKIYKRLCEFTCLIGTFCGVVGVLFNINFLENPNFLDYRILKGLISHTIMVFGTVYLYVMNYVKIEVDSNMKSIIFGLLIFITDGIIVNLLYYIFGFEPVNAMYMIKPPFENFPVLNFFTIGILGLGVCFGLLNLYELVKYPEEQRWLTKIRLKHVNKK